MKVKSIIKPAGLVSIIFFQILFILTASFQVGVIYLLITFLFVLWFWYSKSYDSMNFALLYFLIQICLFMPYVRYWPMPCGFALFTAAQFLFPNLRKNSNWFKPGNFNAKTLILLLTAIIASSGILILWYFAFLPDLSPMVQSLKDKPPAVIAAAIIGFAVINAVVEECIYDGICYKAMEEHFKIPLVFIGLQAVSYSISHFHGIPSGYSGLLLSFIYGGVMLGGLRYLSKGLLYPVIAHIFADLTIAILAFSAS